MDGLFFRSKYKVMRRHHERLLVSPNPDLASDRFLRRLRAARRTWILRNFCMFFLYAALISAVTSFLLGQLGEFAQWFEPLRTLLGLASSVSLVFLLGLVACNHYLGLLDVELYYYSAEARGAAPGTTLQSPTTGLK